MGRHNYTAEMRRMALDAVSDFFSVHQAEMTAHELVASTHLLHTLAIAVERNTLWEEKRRQKLGIPDVSARTEHSDGDEYEDDEHSLPENHSPVPIRLGSLEDVLKDRSAFSDAHETVEPVRKPAVPEPARAPAPKPPLKPQPRPVSPVLPPRAAPKPQPAPHPAPQPTSATPVQRQSVPTATKPAARVRDDQTPKLQQHTLDL